MAPHKKHNGLIPAVVYYRMSSDKHEASILEQCEAVERYTADNGYRIIREYVDEGISGDKTGKRTAFLRCTMTHAMVVTLIRYSVGTRTALDGSIRWRPASTFTRCGKLALRWSQ